LNRNASPQQIKTMKKQWRYLENLSIWPRLRGWKENLKASLQENHLAIWGAFMKAHGTATALRTA
jgi:hypothetical protein